MRRTIRRYDYQQPGPLLRRRKVPRMNRRVAPCAGSQRHMSKYESGPR